MPEINLLPWREELREERKRQFLSVMAGVVILAVVLGGLWSFGRSSAIDGQLAVNNELKRGISQLESKVREIEEIKKEKADMLDRMDVIKNLQGNRPEIVKLFDQFVRVVPDGSYVSRVEASGTTFSVQGKAESNQRISALMRQLDEAAKFSEPDLTTVTADRELGDQGSSFEMTATIVNETKQALTLSEQSE